MAKQLGYRYPLEVERVIDSDTVVAWVRVSSNTKERWRIRIVGVEGGELDTTEGLAGRLLLCDTLKSFAACSMHFVGLETILDKYGRHVGDICFEPNTLLSLTLLATGHFWKRNRNGVEFKSVQG